jgi:hypothetical protein
LSRLIWAALSVSTAKEDWLRLGNSALLLKTLVLVIVFVCLEIAPVLVAVWSLDRLVEGANEGTPPRGLTWEEFKSEGVPLIAKHSKSNATQRDARSVPYQVGLTWEEIEAGGKNISTGSVAGGLVGGSMSVLKSADATRRLLGDHKNSNSTSTTDLLLRVMEDVNTPPRQSFNSIGISSSRRSSGSNQTSPKRSFVYSPLRDNVPSFLTLDDA